MFGSDPAGLALEARATFWRRCAAFLVVLAAAATTADVFTTISFVSANALTLAGLLSLILSGALFAHSRAKTRLESYRIAENHIVSALDATRSSAIYGLRRRLFEAAAKDRAILGLYARHKPTITQRLEEVLQGEVLEARRANVAARCAEATKTLIDRLEERRLASPAIRAEQTITGAIESLKQHKAAAEKQLDEQRERSFFKWWLDLTRPAFEEVDTRIKELDTARRRLIASGDIVRTDEYFRALTSLVERRTTEIERAARSAIPARREDKFDDQRIVQNALLLSALSSTVSAWSDISQAGSVYATLREVSGNYADMSDADIWLDTLAMSGPELAGLANLTKGALFEKHVEADFAGERFEHFNHPDTDILIDGIAYQIKATDSVSYMNSVADHIPVISTSEIADITGSIDGGYTNEDLTNAIDLALGGTVLDIGDTAFDAMLTGVGGVGIFSILRGVQSASAKYKESGDAFGCMVEGAIVYFTSQGRVGYISPAMSTQVLDVREVCPTIYGGRRAPSRPPPSSRRAMA